MTLSQKKILARVEMVDETLRNAGSLVEQDNRLPGAVSTDLARLGGACGTDGPVAVFLKH
jgi:hypothetical protein